ncbi:hypothetical protein ABIB57_003997 [Devosia sp. UYZn731]|uniref:hypothetical protein n=1 Tax=Devosia sp. UYZn731 TaxID=3156345 RepID=UPI00339129ED
MPSKPKMKLEAKLVREWTLPAAATLGSSVRARGILLEMRARLPAATKKSLDIVGAVLALRMTEGAEEDFRTASEVVSKALVGIEDLPVIPREIQDILSISTTERHRWLKDGRLQSAGTRTVKLRGRAKKITFHVFNPRHVEEVLNEDLISAWREDDAETKAENRRQAAWKARLKRTPKASGELSPETTADDGARHKLKGWDEFERDGLLR